MRLELARVGLLAELPNHYTTRGALATELMDVVGFVVELASSKRICSRCLDMVSVVLA